MVQVPKYPNHQRSRHGFFSAPAGWAAAKVARTPWIWRFLSIGWYLGYCRYMIIYVCTIYILYDWWWWYWWYIVCNQYVISSSSTQLDIVIGYRDHICVCAKTCRSIVSIYSVSRNVLLGCPTFHHTFACRWGSRVQARPLHVLLHPFFAELLCCKRRDGWTIGSQNGGLVKIDFVWKKKTTVKTWWCKLWTMKNSILLGRSYTYGTLFLCLLKDFALEIRFATWGDS